MHLKLIVAVLVTSTMLAYAQAQDPNPVRRPPKGLSKLSAVTLPRSRQCCAIGKIGVQIEDANEAKDKKTADTLTQKMRGLEKQLGPEYFSLMYGLQEIDRNPTTASRSRRC